LSGSSPSLDEQTPNHLPPFKRLDGFVIVFRNLPFSQYFIDFGLMKCHRENTYRIALLILHRMRAFPHPFSSLPIIATIAVKLGVGVGHYCLLVLLKKEGAGLSPFFDLLV
jgi:hypothetical protein